MEVAFPISKMITSKQILSLSEKYLDSIKINGNLIPIYENPTYDDYKELNVHMIRFIADARPPQRVYVWNAALVIHDNMNDFLHYGRGKTGILTGLCRYSSGIPRFIESTDIEYALTRLSSKQNVDWLSHFIFDYDWKWLDRFIENSSSRMEDYHKRFKEKLSVGRRIF